MAFWDFVRKPGSGGPRVVVLDFGSGSVKALMTTLEEAKRIGYVVGFGKRFYPPQVTLQTLEQLEMIVSLAEEAITDSFKASRAKTSECLLVLNSGMFKSHLFKWQEIRENSHARIDEDELQTMLEKISRNAKMKAERQFGIPANQLVVTDGAIQRVIIDGYHVVNPLGFKGNKVELGVYIFYLSKEEYHYWQEVLKILKLKEMGLVASIFATIQAQLKHTLEGFGAIFVDVGQHSTDVALVRDSILEGIKTFEFGGRMITDGIANLFKVGFEDAVRKKIDYELGNLEESEVRKLEVGLKDKVDLLRQALVVALKDFPETTQALPEKIYLCGGGVRLGIIKKMLSQSSWLAELPFVRKPQVEVLLPTDVKDVIDTTESFGGPDSVSLLSSVRWLTRHYRVTAKVDHILRKAFKII